MLIVRRIGAVVCSVAARGAVAALLLAAAFAADAGRPAAATGFFDEMFAPTPGVRYLDASPARSVTPYRSHHRHKLRIARRHVKMAHLAHRHAKTPTFGVLVPVVARAGALERPGRFVRQTAIRLHAAPVDASPAPYDRAAAARPRVAGQTVVADDFLVDSTLRPGDVVVTSHGLRVFRGRAAPRHAFLSLSESRDMPRAKHGALAAIDRVLKTPRKDMLPLSGAPH